MTATQTKLSRAEKIGVRIVLTEFEEDGGYVFSFPIDRVTVAIKPAFEGSRMARAAVSIAAPTETKFRKLVGIDRALFSLCELDQAVPMVLNSDFWDGDEVTRAAELEGMAEDLARTVSANG